MRGQVPYILSIGMKRFDYDWMADERVKVCPYSCNIPMENPYCSCKLVALLVPLPSFSPPLPRPVTIYRLTSTIHCLSLDLSPPFCDDLSPPFRDLFLICPSSTLHRCTTAFTNTCSAPPPVAHSCNHPCGESLLHL